MRRFLLMSLIGLACTAGMQAHAANWVLESHWGGQGTGPGELQDPRALAIGPNDHVYVADYGNARVQQFDADGNFVRAWGAQGEVDVSFEYLKGITVDLDGSVYVLDGSHIEKFTAEGQFLTTTDRAMRVYGYSLDASQDNTIYTVGAGRVTGYDTELNVVISHDVTGCLDDSYGGIASAQGHLYLTDSPCQSIDEYSEAGERLNHWTVTGLLSCFSIAESNEQLFLTSPTEKAIRILNSEGSDVDRIAIPPLDGAALFPTVVAAHNDRVYVLAGDRVLVFSHQTPVEGTPWTEMKDRYQ